MEYRHIIELRLCESHCQGQSCCDCCGKAPAIHLQGRTAFRSNDGMTGVCCRQIREKKPDECMHLRGLLRREWLSKEKDSYKGEAPRLNAATQKCVPVTSPENAE